MRTKRVYIQFKTTVFKFIKADVLGYFVSICVFKRTTALFLLFKIVPTSNDQSAVHIAQLLHEANLTDLIQLDPINQIKYFLDERIQLIDEVS
jgi:hypothetical protein